MAATGGSDTTAAPAEPTEPVASPGPIVWLYEQMDRHVFNPFLWIVTNPVHITALLLLGVLLMFNGSNAKFELVGGNYTNIMSAAAGVILLYRQNQQSKVLHQQSRDIERLHKAHREHLHVIRELLGHDASAIEAKVPDPPAG